MTIEAEFAYMASFTEIYAKLTDETFLRSKYEDIGSRNLRFSECAQDDEVFRIEWTREVPANPPPFARKFFGEWNSLQEIMEWTLEDDGSAHADYQCKISGIPGVLEGEFDLRPDGSGCVEEIIMKATIRIPIVGGKISTLVEDDCKQQLDKEDAFTRRQLGED